MISINNNLSANSVARVLSDHYSRLQTSTQRLSSGLRINGAADDAAGLAIRELMRSDIAALRQGMRNVNDGISMLQTMDGALGVIDEKLIRMKELAEQAATGTYDSTQRLMIDSEFQAMGSEINRIANATDFNGIKLLCTKMITWYTDEDKFVVTDPGSVSDVKLPNGKNGNPVLRGINPANYIDENNPTKTISVSLTATEGTKTTGGTLQEINTVGNTTQYKLQDTEFSVAYLNSLGDASNPIIEYASANKGNISKGWSIKDADGAYGMVAVNPGDTQVGGVKFLGNGGSVIFRLANDKAGPVDMSDMDDNITAFKIDTGANTYSITRKSIEINADTPDYTASYNEANNTVTVTLKNGGKATLRLDNALEAGDAISFDINLEGEVKTVQVPHTGVDPNQKLKIHFGPMNDSAEDYYYINFANCTLEGLGLANVDIQTQDNAQNALVQINDAIVIKDKVRADFGAMQNRLENTMTNLSIQAENLQAAESRISDADIAQEMMIFVRNQILTNSAVAMLAQANSLPQMVMMLIH